MITAKAIKHLDVYEKEQYWLRISNGEHNVMVNVGKKTYDNVKELENVQELQIPTTDSPENYANYVDDFVKPNFAEIKKDEKGALLEIQDDTRGRGDRRNPKSKS